MKKRRKGKLRVLVACILLTILAYVGWKHFHTASDTREAASQREEMRVTVVSPVSKAVRQTVHVTGVTTAREEVLVQSELTNLRITRIYADAGDQVKRGARLATLDDANLKLQLQQARADAAKAGDEYHRFQSVAGTGAVSAQSVVEKRTALESARARLADAALNLKHATITAPSGGTVTERRASIGEMVSATVPLYRIAQGSKVEAELQVPEAALAELQVKQNVDIFPNGGGTPLKGTIRLVTPRIDSASRTAVIRVALPSSKTLPVGLFVNATITTGEVQGMVIPDSALQRGASGTYVWQVGQEGVVARLAVEVVFQREDTVVIKDIPPGTRLVAKAGSFVKEGDRVSVIAEGQP